MKKKRTTVFQLDEVGVLKLIKDEQVCVDYKFCEDCGDCDEEELEECKENECTCFPGKRGGVHGYGPTLLEALDDMCRSNHISLNKYLLKF